LEPARKVHVIANEEGHLQRIWDRRVNSSTGQEEYLVSRSYSVSGDSDLVVPASGSAGGATAGADAGGTRLWVPREMLVLDGAGAAYGERGGQYGLHGEGSTRVRLQVLAV
jgi:hypothetical protein